MVARKAENRIKKGNEDKGRTPDIPSSQISDPYYFIGLHVGGNGGEP